MEPSSSGDVGLAMREQPKRLSRSYLKWNGGKCDGFEKTFMDWLFILLPFICFTKFQNKQITTTIAKSKMVAYASK